MKKYFIFLFFVSTLVIIGQTDKKVPHDQTANVKGNNNNKTYDVKQSSDHSKLAINCKTCHNCEYPTRQDPCLIICPRKDMISIYHSPSEGPEVLVINELSDKYTTVIFSHKLHAQMSEMSDGCSGCHHYNTTGPILNCKKCHEIERKREDITKPDLQGAFHRQCMQCHRQWSRSTGCTKGCHLQKSPEKESQQLAYLKSLVGREHPELPKPNKVVYETRHEKAKYVTFYHNEHAELFNIKCINCHKHENCTKCHDKSLQTPQTQRVDAPPKKIHKSFEEHHKPCSQCHKTDNCTKCHANKQQDAFNHDVSTKFPLGKFHSYLTCGKCHTDKKFNKLNMTCTSCHKNFKAGVFDHTKTGLSLSDNHKDAECETCHADNDFSKKPACNSCHDDKTSDKFLPGKKLALIKKPMKKHKA